MITKEQVYEILRNCYDPEIPVNVVDLGLIYDVGVTEDTVHVKMTLTTPGCGMARMICTDVESRLQQADGVSQARVELVWEPPWNPGMMSDSAKKQLGLD